jgi:hypothetical protein
MGMAEFSREDVDRLRRAHVRAFMSDDADAWRATSQELRRYLKAAGLESPVALSPAGRLQKIIEIERERLHKKHVSHKCPCLRWRGLDTQQARIDRLYACPNPCPLGRNIADRLKTVDSPGIAGIEQQQTGDC